MKYPKCNVLVDTRFLFWLAGSMAAVSLLHPSLARSDGFEPTAGFDVTYHYQMGSRPAKELNYHCVDRTQRGTFTPLPGGGDMSQTMLSQSACSRGPGTFSMVHPDGGSMTVTKLPSQAAPAAPEVAPVAAPVEVAKAAEAAKAADAAPVPPPKKAVVAAKPVSHSPAAHAGRSVTIDPVHIDGDWNAYLTAHPAAAAPAKIATKDPAFEQISPGPEVSSDANEDQAQGIGNAQVTIHTQGTVPGGVAGTYVSRYACHNGPISRGVILNPSRVVSVAKEQIRRAKDVCKSISKSCEWIGLSHGRTQMNINLQQADVSCSHLPSSSWNPTVLTSSDDFTQNGCNDSNGMKPNLTARNYQNGEKSALAEYARHHGCSDLSASGRNPSKEGTGESDGPALAKGEKPGLSATGGWQP